MSAMQSLTDSESTCRFGFVQMPTAKEVHLRAVADVQSTSIRQIGIALNPDGPMLEAQTQRRVARVIEHAC